MVVIVSNHWSIVDIANNGLDVFVFRILFKVLELELPEKRLGRIEVYFARV